VAGGWRDCILRSFVTSTPHEILLGNYIKENEMGWICSTHGRDEKCTILVRKRGGKRLLGRLVTDGRIILQLIFEK
jgi:hypothetical protein